MNAGPVPSLEGLRVLVVDDEPDICLGLQKLIGSLGAEVVAANGGRQALEIVDHSGTDLVLTDLMMPGMSGAELLLEMKKRSPATPVVILTGFGTIQTAVSCLQNGATHFLTKPFDNHEILGLVGRLGRQVFASRRRREAEPWLAERMVVRSPRMRQVLELVDRVAASPVPVLIEGESGTGKELIARRIHAKSSLRERPFLAVNAAALPDTLLESELFGHKRGAFTGADRERKGLFVEACGGTVFLDEVASMSPAFQGKLLRVLQEKVVRPLGSPQDVRVDFRLVAATNRDLEQMIRRETFREDLFYRLGVVKVFIPALRDRPEDIPALALHFLARGAQDFLGPGEPVPELSPAALEALQKHSWPGNVRELENTIQRSLIVCGEGRILPHHLGLHGGEDPPGKALDYESGKQAAIQRFQQDFVERALKASRGNVSQAATACGLTRSALQKIMRQLGLERSAYRRT